MNFSRILGTTLILGVIIWSSPDSLEAYEESPNLKGSVIKGRVTFQGTITKTPLLEVNRDQKFCGETLQDNSLLVDSTSKGIFNIVVNLKGIASGKSLPQENSLRLENRNCAFQPSVILGVKGSMLNIENADPVLHNTHILQDDHTFLNVALPSEGRTIRKAITETGRLDVFCDAHQFMHASVHIFDHPYFTSTDKKGYFELTNVPPGKHRIQFWHPTLGMKELSLTVKGSAPLIFTVSFP